ncbi:GMC family oxidoreductase N-terminal domain-containing protein [Vulgatibacter sp.]|uniref:GMC family oxidoreductase N-terminal domain-containing protein n=1 Tax=Vulgatibacter sp. TaxID=1971226 RepID=UPI0035663E33
MAETTPILEGRQHAGDLSLDADVVIVGSGAAGSVAAAICAEAGLSVIVLEEGGHVPPERYARFRPSETMQHMFRDAGTTAALGLGDTPLLSILAGRTVGGSSTLTGGVIFRIPEPVLEEWGRVHGLRGFSPADLEPAYKSVEETSSVHTVPASMQSRSTTFFARGARRLGYGLEPMRRNTVGCLGSSRCNFGCPHRAKMSVDLTYLLRARERGALVIADCRVTRLRIESGRAAGVEGRLLDGEGRRRGRVRIRARRVILAASALSTPLLLQREGVGRWSGHVGRHLSLHPAARVAAFFDEDVSGWKGAMQSAYADAFQDEGLTLNSIFTAPNVIAAMLPGIGREFTEYAGRMRHLATFGLMVHDEGGGRVWRLPGDRALFTYRMAPRDKARLIRGIKLLAETWFAAGAREVLLPVFGQRPIRSPDELAFLDDPNIRAKRFECLTFHPLGSARMGRDRSAGAVRETGETFDVEGLYVIDGSIFPTSIGVNSQLPIMALATKLAWGIAEDFRRAPAIH